MANSNEAEEHLRVIRGLMERSTIYRAISAPTALVGGVLSGMAAVWLGQRFDVKEAPGYYWAAGIFHPFWIGVLLLTLAFNTYSLLAKARRFREPFFSAGLKLACRMAFPSYFTAVVLTVSLLCFVPEMLCIFAIIWLICHGLGMLSTQAFAPKSIFYLGWAFLLTGIIYFLLVFLSLDFKNDYSRWNPRNLHGFWAYLERFSREDGDDRPLGNRLVAIATPQMVNYLLGLTFGGYHLIYAMLTWPRGGKKQYLPGGITP